jgi:hypothetical protein
VEESDRALSRHLVGLEQIAFVKLWRQRRSARSELPGRAGPSCTEGRRFGDVCGVQSQLAGQRVQSGTDLGGVDRGPQPFVSIGPLMPYDSTKRQLVWKTAIDHARG